MLLKLIYDITYQLALLMPRCGGRCFERNMAINMDKAQGKTGVSGSTLKIIAVACMLIDHTAAVLLGHILVDNGIYSVADFSFEYMQELIQASSIGWVYFAYQVMRRIIGRMAFPIYCFLLIEGFEKTKNRLKYAGRLFVFALISEIPFDLAQNGEAFYPYYQNVFFTLFIGLVMIWLMEKIERRCQNLIFRLTLWAAVFLAASVLVELIYCDYGAHGTIAIALLYLFRKNKLEQMIAGCIAFLWEITAPFAFVFIALYNGKRGIRLKYFFYIFYPAHLLVLYLLTWIL